jgi:hypothetical protein
MRNVPRLTVMNPMGMARHLLLGVLLALGGSAPAGPTNSAAVISAVFRADRELSDVPFATVIEATTGHKIVPIDLRREADRELIRKLGAALDEVLRRMNATNSVAQRQRRINEVSGRFEDELRAVLDGAPGFACDFPRTAAGRVQRSGYPDLHLVDRKSGTVVYVDPKLFERGSRASSFRTFYYEPKVETSKIHDDAHHLIVGIEHDGRAAGRWRFLNWELVDVSGLRVRLKAEFQSSNRELYRPELIVGSSRKPSPP